MLYRILGACCMGYRGRSGHLRGHHRKHCRPGIRAYPTASTRNTERKSGPRISTLVGLLASAHARWIQGLWSASQQVGRSKLAKGTSSYNTAILPAYTPY